MKKYLNLAFLYAIAAMVAGVFYREFTKLNGFSGKTTLSVVHTHLFLLGMFLMLIVALFADRLPLEGNAKFRWFWRLYNIGVPVTGVMLLVRGVPQVLGTTLSAGLDASISGLAGLGHILTGTGIVFLFLALREAAGKAPRRSKA